MRKDWLDFEEKIGFRAICAENFKKLRKVIAKMLSESPLTLPPLIWQFDTDDDLRTPSSGSLRRTSTRRADSSQSSTPTDTPASIGRATKAKNAKKVAAVQTATSDDTEDDETTPPGKMSIN